MGKIIRYLFLVLVFSLLAGMAAVYGFYELKTAEAVEASVAFDFIAAEDMYVAVGNDLSQLKKVPAVLNGWWDEIEVKGSEARYWQKKYSSLLNFENGADATEQVPQLVFIRGNSEYRMIETSEDRKIVIEGIERAIRDYFQTIKADPDHFDSSFNYEYLLRLRSEVARPRNAKELPLKDSGPPADGKGGEKSDQEGSQPAGPGQGLHGQEGSQAPDSVETTIKIQVPLTGQEAEEKGPGSGKGDAQRGKG